MDNATDNRTSPTVKVKIEVEPNKVVQTSPTKLGLEEKMFIKRYPMARELTESMAMAASPFNLKRLPKHSNKIAQRMVTGKTKIISFPKFKIPATAIAANATWDRPSPMSENRFKTKVTPNKEEQRATTVPTISAWRTKG